MLTTSSAAPGTVPHAPNLVVGLALERPGMIPAATALRVLTGAVSRGSARTPRRRSRLLRRVPRDVSPAGARDRLHLVIDYRVDQLGRQANSQGAVMVEGTWCCPAMPDAWSRRRSTCAPARSTPTPTRVASRRARDYALRRKSGPDADGYERFMCPGPGRASEACAARCDPPSLARLGTRTVETHPHEPPTLCRQHAITIAPDVGGAPRPESFPYGSEEWARHYATLRNTIEGWNGFVKDPAHEALAQPARRRVRGIAAQGIFVTLALVAANLRKDRDSPLSDGPSRRARSTKTCSPPTGELDGLPRQLTPVTNRSLTI